MPQTFVALQCAFCHAYQVQQDKKSKKFTCTLCGEKQSFRAVLAVSNSAADVRRVVQELNGLRGAAGAAAGEEQAPAGAAAAAAAGWPPGPPPPAVDWAGYCDERGAAGSGAAEAADGWAEGEGPYVTSLPDGEQGGRRSRGRGGAGAPSSKRRRTGGGATGGCGDGDGLEEGQGTCGERSGGAWRCQWQGSASQSTGRGPQRAHPQLRSGAQQLLGARPSDMQQQQQQQPWRQQQQQQQQQPWQHRQQENGHHHQQPPPLRQQPQPVSKPPTAAAGVRKPLAASASAWSSFVPEDDHGPEDSSGDEGDVDAQGFLSRLPPAAAGAAHRWG